MAKKTSVSSESSELETKTKPKKKVVRKKKADLEDQVDLSVLPNNGGPVQMDSVIDPIAAERAKLILKPFAISISLK